MSIGEFVQSILSSTFIQGLLNIIFSVVIAITNIILYPFGFIIQALLPSLDGALDAISTYFTYVSQGIAWGVSAFAIPPIVLSLIVGYAVFSFYLPFQLWGLKLALSWKKALWG